MGEWDGGLKDFFTHWFSGLVEGLEGVDAASRTVILSACGKACAHSYTVQIFQEARQNSSSIDSFLEALAVRLPAACYERVGPNSIRVTYRECGCDLVRLGLVSSPLLCECSAHNLQENLECSWGRVASVEIQTSILRGGEQCVLTVTMAENFETQ